MVLIFDLDDTLFAEMDFVHCQLRHVSHMIQERLGYDHELAYQLMKRELDTNGRGRVFDVMLDTLGVLSRKNVRLCLSAYRRQPTQLQLPGESLQVLQRFRHLPKYVVTEGNPIAQRNKLRALQLEPWIKKALITHQFGLRHAKPSPYCFLKIAHWEKRPPCEVIYIGDNPGKDFCGIRPVGFKTIRVLTGRHRHMQVPAEQDALIHIQSLNELTLALLEHLKIL